MENFKNQNDKGFLARPLDRLAAFIVDMGIVLMPLLVLLSSPLKSLAGEALLLEDDKALYIIYVALVMFSSLVIFSYHFLMHFFWGKTLGEYTLNIKVVDLWGFNTPSKSQLMFRSLLWTLSLFMLGLPFLSLFTGSKRRSLVDRLSDTVVVSFTARGTVGPTYLEKRSVQYSVGFLGFFFAFMTFSFLYRVSLHYESKEYSISSLEQESLLCKDIGLAHKEWESKGYDQSRMNVAMSLYAAGSINEDCLSRETEFMFRNGVESPLNYLASSFIYSENTDVSDKYLNKVCELDKESSACLMSQTIDAWSEGDFAQVEQLFGNMNVKENPYSALWAVRFNFKTLKNTKVKKLLAQIPESQFLTEFISSYKIKNKWMLGETKESAAMLELSGSFLKKSTVTELNAWVCAEQSFKSCGEKRSACESLESQIKAQPKLLSEPRVALSYVEHKLCEGEEPLYPDFISPVVYQAYDRVKDWYPDSPDESMDYFLTSQDIPLEVKSFIRRQLISKTSGRLDLEEHAQAWFEEADGLEKFKVGHVLFNKFNSFNLSRKAMHVGEVLVGSPYKALIGPQMLSLTYKLKNMDAAKKAYADFDIKPKYKSGLSRVPASASYSKILKEVEEAL